MNNVQFESTQELVAITNVVEARDRNGEIMCAQSSEKPLVRVYLKNLDGSDLLLKLRNGRVGTPLMAASLFEKNGVIKWVTKADKDGVETTKAVFQPEAAITGKLNYGKTSVYVVDREQDMAEGSKRASFAEGTIVEYAASRPDSKAKYKARMENTARAKAMKDMVDAGVLSKEDLVKALMGNPVPAAMPVQDVTKPSTEEKASEPETPEEAATPEAPEATAKTAETVREKAAQ